MEPRVPNSRLHSHSRSLASPTDAVLDSWTQIVDYLAGDGSPEERAAVEQWLCADPGRLSAFEQIRDEWNAKSGFQGLADLDTAWANVHGAIVSRSMPAHTTRSPLDLSHVPSRTGTRGRRWGVMGGIGAVGIAMLVGLFLGTLRHDARPTGTIYRTAPGQRTTISLADGSVMTLAPATTVRVTTRAITVDGEAYFTAASRTVRPFVVETRNIAIQVLGTRFWVRQYSNEARSRVVVDEGKVGVQSLRTSVTTSTSPTRAVLSAQMMAQISDSGITVTSGVSTREYTGSTEGILVFRRVPLREVAVELSRGYGTEVRVADSTLAQEPIIAEVDVRNRTLPQVLEFICFVMNAHSVSQGDTIVLAPGRDKNLAPRAPTPSFRHPQQEKMYGR